MKIKIKNSGEVKGKIFIYKKEKILRLANNSLVIYLKKMEVERFLMKQENPQLVEN